MLPKVYTFIHIHLINDTCSLSCTKLKQDSLLCFFYYRHQRTCLDFGQRAMPLSSIREYSQKLILIQVQATKHHAQCESFPILQQRKPLLPTQHTKLTLSHQLQELLSRFIFFVSDQKNYYSINKIVVSHNFQMHPYQIHLYT